MEMEGVSEMDSGVAMMSSLEIRAYRKLDIRNYNNLWPSTTATESAFSSV